MEQFYCFIGAASKRKPKGGPGYNSGYTKIVKTAVSVPDDLFRLAEVAARRLRVSRSQLYATALSEFLKRHHGSSVTERLNEVYSRRPAKVDSALHRAQLKSIEKDSW
jgi:metal-responsive CopG/Arc/MetJ family transcriptional regulator